MNVKKNKHTPWIMEVIIFGEHSRQEIDWIEEKDGALKAYEFKWAMQGKAKIPQAWLKGYPDATFEIIDRSNYMDFIL